MGVMVAVIMKRALIVGAWVFILDGARNTAAAPGLEFVGGLCIGATFFTAIVESFISARSEP